jgi:hypothetical protein
MPLPQQRQQPHAGRRHALPTAAEETELRRGAARTTHTACSAQPNAACVVLRYAFTLFEEVRDWRATAFAAALSPRLPLNKPRVATPRCHRFAAVRLSLPRRPTY